MCRHGRNRLWLVPMIDHSQVLALVSDVGGPIRDAMLRDIFSADEWELKHGGVTGLKARLAIVGQMGFALAMAIGNQGIIFRASSCTPQ